MTLDRIHEVYSNTFFCQLSKWGNIITEEEAKKLGLPIDVAPKAPEKPVARKPRTTNRKTKEGIE